MSDEPFGRQPQPVTVTFNGEQIDIDYYMNKIARIIEGGSYDVTTRVANSLRIYPRAVND